eukprot:360528-Chlamydomonas_euryale.AAC.4
MLTARARVAAAVGFVHVRSSGYCRRLSPNRRGGWARARARGRGWRPTTHACCGVAAARGGGRPPVPLLAACGQGLALEP